MKETPWSRIQGQNSVDKDFLEIVGNGKPTGSALKETLAVSVTISISVQNRHSRILLRALLRGRMREMHREPEVLEAEAQVGKWFDCRARITPKELAPLHSVKSGILQNACSTRPRVVADLGKSALMRIAKLTNSLARSKKNGDKSAVVVLKKNEQNYRMGRPIVYDSSNTRQLGCVFQGVEPPKSSSILRRAQTYGNRSDVKNSRKPLYVTLTFETKILRSE